MTGVPRCHFADQGCGYPTTEDPRQVTCEECQSSTRYLLAVLAGWWRHIRHRGRV